MTSVLKADDKILNMYKQYRTLIHEDAEENGQVVYGVDQMASRLTVAHMLDHVVCLLKNEEETPIKGEKAPKTLLETYQEELGWC